MTWVDKRWSLKQLHLEVFRYFRGVIGEWIDWTDKDSDKPYDAKINLRELLINFPYSEGKMTKKQFMEMDIEKCFEMCFPGINKEDQDDILEMPYKIVFKDVTGYWDECHYCGQ